MFRSATYLVLLLALQLTIVSCAKPDNAFRDQFRWLSGKWRGVDQGVEMIEHWKWNKYRFEGQGYNIKEGDTIFMEQLFLSDYAGTPGFTAVLDDRGPYTFGLIGIDDNTFQFKNDDHDFPCIIHYRQDSDTSLTISLMSKESPNEANVSYQMTRQK